MITLVQVLGLIDQLSAYSGVEVDNSHVARSASLTQIHTIILTGSVVLLGAENERVHRTVYTTKTQARRDVISYIEGFYNPRRRHSAIGYKRPNEVHYANIQPATAA